MPMEILKLALNNAIRGGVALTEIEKAQLTLLVNAVKAKFSIACTGLTVQAWLIQRMAFRQITSPMRRKRRRQKLCLMLN